MILVDSHCHLEYDGLSERQDQVVANARAARVGTMLNISTKRAEWGRVVATAHRYPDVWASVGIHPHHADEHLDLTDDELFAAAQDARVIGLGETGLDFYYGHSDPVAQEQLFRMHIRVSRITGLPVIIHTRDAEDETLAILESEMADGAFPALIHCFTASADFARGVLEMGFSISLSGIVTFKNAVELQQVAKAVPQDRLLVETDSPFLAPVPHRGKPCEPAFVRDTAQFLADLRGETAQELAAFTTRNFHALFAKAAAA